LKETTPNKEGAASNKAGGTFTASLERMGYKPGLIYQEQLFEFFEGVMCTDTTLSEKERGNKLREMFEKRKQMYPSRTLLALKATALSMQKNPQILGAIYRLVDGESRLFDLSEVMLYSGKAAKNTRE
jgi:hypothetical protein